MHLWPVHKHFSGLNSTPNTSSTAIHSLRWSAWPHHTPCVTPHTSPQGEIWLTLLREKGGNWQTKKEVESERDEERRGVLLERGSSCIVSVKKRSLQLIKRERDGKSER